MPFVNVVADLWFEDSDGHKVQMGSPVAEQIEVDGEVHDLAVDIAAAATKVIFDATTDIDEFDALFLLSDKDTVDVELMCDQNNGVGQRVFVISLRAGFVQPILTNRSFANYTAAFAAGTADVIDKVTLKNNGTETAKVRCLAFT